MGAIRQFGALLDRLGDGLSAVARFVLLAILVLINVEVAGRYLLGYSTLIADEYGGYMFTWVLMFGFLHAHRHGHFLRVSILRLRLGTRGRHVLDAISAAIGVFLAAIAGYGAWQTFSVSWAFGSTSAFASETPLVIPQVALPLGIGLLFLSFLEELLRHAVLAAAPEPLP
jgi:TRAP-type C4-dicarboxylate transport system permease small subunit